MRLFDASGVLREASAPAGLGSGLRETLGELEAPGRAFSSLLPDVETAISDESIGRRVQTAVAAK